MTLRLSQASDLIAERAAEVALAFAPRRASRRHRRGACNARRLSGKPGGWREVVLNRQQLDFGGDQISPAKRSIAARQPYTTSVLRRPARVCGFSTRPFLCPTATAESAILVVAPRWSDARVPALAE